MAAAAALVVVGLAFAAFGDDIKHALKRAASGQKAEPGVVVVKTSPSGADVTIDGKNKGKTNLKVTGIDITEPHRLVVTPKDKPPIVMELTKADFQAGEDGWPTFVFDKDAPGKKDGT